MTHVAVLMGGMSQEREVSLVTGAAVAESLNKLGFQVTSIDVSHNLSSVLDSLSPDIAFNALHGRFGEDGTVQGLLETLRIPYTHSGVLASALAMDKIMSKKVFLQAGINCTEGRVFSIDEVCSDHVFEPPYVIKPINEGSSVGVSIIMENEHVPTRNKIQWGCSDKVLVEKYVHGKEVTVAIVDDKAIGVTEIQSLHKFYDYEAKYQKGQSKHLVPAPLPKDEYEEVMEISLAAHQALGCRGISRADFRYNNFSSNKKFFLMEINTQPGFTPVSLVPEIALFAGISFDEIVQLLIDDAGCDK